ncbi:MAG TPA: Ig-like domain-containing protein [Chitinophaga sp.]|uniref:Ig-like domain-containing protein n=1 Tax=Chitinophaga sp. TaxID=1869181 RepID=UPI002DB70834|nr:Ig-like domain-containing protein [Chitinophaga sp.]HEU4553585.1 Ig-like domain-containing protein [Chitinophaga sp.]
MIQRFRRLVLGFIVIASFLLSRCANIVPPGGGPRDTLPPLLLAVDPPDSTLHFNSRKVHFNFDEYVELDNVFDKMIVSPTLKRVPTVTSKLRTVTMEIKDTLQPNTTYTFNFSDAIKDVNERNPIIDFSYVVSTGDYLDSLQVLGRTINAETGKIDSNVSVMLYRNTADSVVSKEKPVYYARSKGNGVFWFKNLAPGDYKLFAIKEEDRDLQYTQPTTELIAFRDSLIHLREQNIRDITMLMFIEQDSTMRPPGEQPPAEEPQPEEKEKDKDKKKKPRLHIQPQLDQNQQELDTPLVLSFSIPLAKMDSAQFHLAEDTLLHPVSFASFTLDSTRSKLSLRYKWKEGMHYRLIVDKTAATDTLNQQLTKADTINFDAKKFSDYGKLFLKLKLSDSTRAALNGDTSIHFVVQLVKEKDIRYSGVIVNGAWTKTLITPGEYEIRILLDQNNNGKWDRGVYYGHPKRQPERVVSFPEKRNIKANWGVKEDLTL